MGVIEGDSGAVGGPSGFCFVVGGGLVPSGDHPPAVASTAGLFVSRISPDPPPPPVTVISEVPVASPAAAVTVARPAATPVTSPDPSTRATDASLDDQSNSAASTLCPFASNAAAVSRTVSATITVSVDGDTVIAAISWATVTTAVPLADPDVAVMVVSPLLAAVTNPVELTSATARLLLVQVTVAPAIVCLSWSRTCAVSRTVASRAGSDASFAKTASLRATLSRLCCRDGQRPSAILADFPLLPSGPQTRPIPHTHHLTKWQTQGLVASPPD